MFGIFVDMGGTAAIIIDSSSPFSLTISIFRRRFNRRREKRKGKWRFAPHWKLTKMARSSGIDHFKSGHIIPPPAVMVETGRDNALHPAPFNGNNNENRFFIGIVGSTDSSQHPIFHHLDSALSDL